MQELSRRDQDIITERARSVFLLVDLCYNTQERGEHNVWTAAGKECV